MMYEAENVNVKCLFDALLKKPNFGKCCMENLIFQNSVKKCILLELSHPISLDLTNSVVLYGKEIVINSALSQENLNGQLTYSSHFNIKNQMFYQTLKGDLCETNGKINKIKIVSFLISEEDENLSNYDLASYIFDMKLQKM
jgi:hypothetical protein